MGVPFAFFELSVVRTERIGRSLMRVTLGGPEIEQFLTGKVTGTFSTFKDINRFQSPFSFPPEHALMRER